MLDDRNGTVHQSGYIARYSVAQNIIKAFFINVRYSSRITNDEREDEMEENMSYLNMGIGNLRNMAYDIGSEIETHNDAIERINRKVRNPSRFSDHRSLIFCLRFNRVEIT